MNRRHARGAATTEFALATLMIVPALLYGVYAGELFVVGAKAQEAEISAAYDLTAYRYHDYETATAAASPGIVASRYDTIARAVSANIDADLKDLNSYASAGRTGVSLVAGTARFQGSAVTCTKRGLKTATSPGSYLAANDLMPFASLDYADDPHFASAKVGADNLRATLTRDWLLSCTSRIEHKALWIPRQWNQEMTSHDDLLNPVTAPIVFGGMGSSLNGLKSGTQPSLGLAMLVDDWAVEQPNRLGAVEIALKDTDSANPSMFRAADRVNRMFWPGLAEEQINEDLLFLLGHRWVFGENTSTGKADDLRLALDDDYNRRTDFQLESPGARNDGNQPWYLLPRQDGENGLTPLEGVASQRARGHYLGHPNASFNQP